MKVVKTRFKVFSIKNYPPYGGSGGSSADTDPKDPYADPKDPFADLTDPYADPKDPYADLTDPHADLTDPHADLTDPYADLTDPYADLTDPYVGTGCLYTVCEYLRTHLTIKLLAVNYAII